MTSYAAGRDGIGGAAQRQRVARFPGRVFSGTVLVLLAVLTYIGTLEHPFVYDDLPLVLKNTQIRSLAAIPAILGFHDGAFELRARFTREITYALEFAAVGPWPPLYRLTNILLHACNALLCCLIFRRITGERILAWLAALLFVVHPIGADVVAQISGRRELLATLFALGTIALLQAYAERGGVLRMLGALACLFCGVFSKEMAIMAPAAFVAADAFAAVRRAPEGLRAAFASHVRRRVWLYGALLLSTVLVASVRVYLTDGGVDRHGSQSYYDTTGNPLDVVDRARVLGLGIRLLAVPVGLSPDYSYDALGLVGQTIPPDGWIDLGFLAVGVLVTILGVLRRSWLGLAGLLFIVLDLPTSGIIPWHEIFAERFLYLPAIGFYLGAAAVLSASIASRTLRRAAIAGTIVLVGALTGATVARNQVWESAESLWAHTVARYPDCARAHKALADEYLAEGRAEDALVHYREAVRILPGYHDARIAVGAALLELGRNDEGRRVLEEVLTRWPDDAKTLNDLGMSYQKTGDLDQAFEYLDRARRSDSTLAEPYNNLGRIFAMRGDVRTAIKLYEQAIERDPSLVPALRNLATMHRYGLRDEITAQRYDNRVRELLTVR